MSKNRWTFSTRSFMVGSPAYTTLTHKMLKELRPEYPMLGVDIDKPDIPYLCVDDVPLRCFDTNLNTPDSLNYLFQDIICLNLKYKYHRELYEYLKLINL